jgi:hypothetical protein
MTAAGKASALRALFGPGAVYQVENVCFGSEADLIAAVELVRYVPEADMVAAIGKAVIASRSAHQRGEKGCDCESPGLVRLRLARARSR